MSACGCRHRSPPDIAKDHCSVNGIVPTFDSHHHKRPLDPPALCNDPRPEPPKEKKEHMLDIVGNHRELTVIGHVSVIKHLPFVHPNTKFLLDQYYRDPGNYVGRPGQYASQQAKIINYGNDYLALKLFDDLTRPEVGDFLINKGWRMIGFTTTMVADLVYIVEKWSTEM